MNKEQYRDKPGMTPLREDWALYCSKRSALAGHQYRGSVSAVIAVRSESVKPSVVTKSEAAPSAMVMFCRIFAWKRVIITQLTRADIAGEASVSCFHSATSVPASIAPDTAFTVTLSPTG